jgi:glycosyltransferase involved in cell wall biosynthesis
MNVTLLVPDIHDRPTGGNIYNRRIITELQEQGSAQAVSWVPVEPPASALDDPSVLVVDSLLVRHEDALRALRRAYASVPLVLLAHYLHCIDPNEQTTDAAERERALLPLFDSAVTTSAFARQALVDEGMPEAQVHAVPPGLDDAYRAPVPERDDGSPTHLLTVANLLPGKGLLDFIDVLGALDDTAWHWTLVGDDTLDLDFADTLRPRIRDAGIADRVTLTGPVAPSDLRAQYDTSDVFVLPSRFETCSMATREAMARGLPVVGYAVGGMPDNFGGVRAGRLVSPDNPGVLTEALQTLLANPAMRVRMGQAARARSQFFPTWAEAGAQLHSALQALSAPEEGTDEKDRP